MSEEITIKRGSKRGYLLKSVYVHAKYNDLREGFPSITPEGVAAVLEAVLDGKPSGQPMIEAFIRDDEPRRLLPDD